MSSDDDTTEPTELDPGMVEPTAPRPTCFCGGSHLTGWCLSGQVHWPSIAEEALARATSAEQERDRLREGIEALAATWERSGGPTWSVVRDLRALLAGSGEQPGPLKSGVMALTGLSSDEVDALGGVREEGEQPGEAVCLDGDATGLDGWCVHIGFRHRTGTPAPAVPELDEGGPRECGCAAAWTCEHDAPVVPDSPDVRYLADRIETAMTDDGHRMPRDAETRYLAFVAAQTALAVVGQGVTAETAWDEGLRAGEAVERARWQWSAGATARAVNGLTERPERPANPYRAVVRSGEQGGEE